MLRYYISNSKNGETEEVFGEQERLPLAVAKVQIPKRFCLKARYCMTF